MDRVRAYFFRGLAVLLPTILTLWIFIWGYNFLKNNISDPINGQIVTIQMKIQHFDESTEEARDQAREKLESFWVKGAGQVAGFVIALTIVLIVGMFLASFVGKSLWRMFERFLLNTPLLGRVYPYVKQVTDFIFGQGEQKKFFSRVVAVEYPRKGSWSIGFVTGSGLRKVRENDPKEEFITVMIPNSPTPLTGFVVMVPKKESILLDLTIEEAFRFIISAGVITPETKADFAIEETIEK